MKNTIKIALLLVFLSTKGFSQLYPSVTNLRSKVLNNATVQIDYTITASTGFYNGAELMRSTDSMFGYITVNTVFGSVGGNAQDYSYQDYPPDPTKKYYYKVRLGGTAESNIIVVNMADVFGNFKILPHPIVDFSRLEFVYTLGQHWVLEIADTKGFFIYRDEYVYTGSYPISRAMFRGNGVYFFRIYLSDGSQLITGKMIVMGQNN